jgi:hypothetical protein
MHYVLSVTNWLFEQKHWISVKPQSLTSTAAFHIQLVAQLFSRADTVENTERKKIRTVGNILLLKKRRDGNQRAHLKIQKIYLY